MSLFDTPDCKRDTLDPVSMISRLSSTSISSEIVGKLTSSKLKSLVFRQLYWGRGRGDSRRSYFLFVSLTCRLFTCSPFICIVVLVAGQAGTI
jgi:hypothetical protein